MPSRRRGRGRLLGFQEVDLMFGFFTHRRPRPAAARPRSTRLTLEALEDRWCPAAPSVTLSVTEMMGHMVRLTGTVTDENPASATVSFSGVVSGGTTADAAGNYTAMAMASTLGTINAIAQDQEGLSSNPVQVNFTSAAPTITLTITYHPQRGITLSGQVTDEVPGGRTVSISGVANGYGMTNADGTFSIDLTASGLGNIQASTSDSWGLTSNTAQVTVASEAPAITDFGGVHQAGNTWTFSGKVSDESAPGLTVRFGGLPSLQTKMAIVESSGWFFLTVTLGPSESGTATAQTTDWWGLDSEEEWFFVSC
jgi:hypothetical protein